MKNVKINLDRPLVDSKSIQAHKDFNGLMKNHAVMSKPFYKSPWFVGTTGLASITIVVGGLISYQSDDPNPEVVRLDTEAPPELVVPENRIIAMNTVTEAISSETNATQQPVNETTNYSDQNQNKLDDKKNTLENPDTQISQKSTIDARDVVLKDEVNETKVEIHEVKHEEVKKDVDTEWLMPRIGGKVNGSITKEELFDNKGITTESDVSVIHFELHIIDGLGGKTMTEESNQLNEEMKAALKKINSGETIYFESIKGKTKEGEIVRLNPLRYVLMN